MRSDRPAANGECRIVGIGASAGGITALQDLLEALPPDPNLSLVIIQHRARSYPSRLVEIMGRWTSLPVRAAVIGERPQRDCVYMASAEDVLTLEGGVFCTRPVDGGFRRPGIDTIDAFLESLAEECGDRAIAVVLSGMGSDGAAGAICVKRAGGVVVAQDPATTIYDSMPRAVIARAAADYILPTSEIAAQLVACASPSYVPLENAGTWTGGVKQTLEDVLGMIRRQAGFDLRGYQATPLLWRIQQRMDACRVKSFADYASLLRDDATELESLIRGSPIHLTQFFRDPEAWEVLSSAVLEPLVRERRADERIRTWTPACATGEEAYSVAMSLSECLEAAGQPIDFQVFASDAAPEILARASRGAFSAHALESMAAERRAKFFDAVDGAHRVKRSLREKMVFAPHDLLVDPPFTGLDLVTCRNLLIYLEPDAIDRVLFLLHRSLRVGGYLFLGRGEPLSRRQQGFEAVSSTWHMYRKIGPAPDSEFEFSLRLDSGPAHDALDPKARSEAIRVSHAELDASREELHALNKELRSARAQLDIANDDRDGLTARLDDKIAELDMQSRVLSSGAVITLFLDEQLRVRWFTPAIEELFPLRPGDIGRPIGHLAPQFDDGQFIPDVLAVMHTDEHREAEVRSREGKWFLRRIRPYLSRTVLAAGVAVTFTDISERKRAEEVLRESAARNELLLKLAEHARAEEDVRARNDELERFNELTAGSESRMIELKKEINTLLTDRGEPARYAVECEDYDRDHGRG